MPSLESSGHGLTLVLVSTIWIYAANAATPPADEQRKSQLGYRLTFGLKDVRHVRWLFMNLLIILGALICYCSASGWQDLVATTVAGWNTSFQDWLSRNLFSVGYGLVALTFLFDFASNYQSFKAALRGSQSLA